MVLDAVLVKSQHYKVWIKGKVEQSRERNSVLPLGAVANEKGAFRLLSTMFTNFTCFYLRGTYDKFPDFFRMGTFIDSTHMKL